MKFLSILSCLLLLGTTRFSAQQEEQNDHKLYLKGNALFAPALVLNAGAEYQISPKQTLQADFLISPWKSFAGNHMQIYMGHVEGRHYFKSAMDGFYLGLNVGFGLYDLTKWNYIGTDKFQRGFNFMVGGTLGYQWQIHEKWNLDAFIGGGTSQGMYHGYEQVPPDKWIRYDKAKDWNKSGEWLPYRGGLMISYKLN